jgi:hypothetical protein
VDFKGNMSYHIKINDSRFLAFEKEFRFTNLFYSIVLEPYCAIKVVSYLNDQMVKFTDKAILNVNNKPQNLFLLTGDLIAFVTPADLQENQKQQVSLQFNAFG